MESEKPTIHNSLFDALKSGDARDLAQKGREVMLNQSMSDRPANVFTEVESASVKLSSSVNEIVEATLVVIGVLQEQNDIMKQNHDDERLMMEILEGELSETRKDNKLTRQLVWVSIIFSVLSVLATGFLINRLLTIVKDQKTYGNDMNHIAGRFYEITNDIKSSQKEIKSIIQQQATFTIKGPNNNDHGSIEIKQMAHNSSGSVDTGTVVIPMNLKGAEVVPPGGPISMTAEKIKEIMKKK